MKTIIAALLCVGFVGQALALDRPDLDQRIQMLTTKFEEMQAKPDKCVPAQMLARAKGIILLDRVKAGLGFAYQGGAGVAMVRRHGAWGPVAFLSANQGSVGVQAGGEEHFAVILLMTSNAVSTLQYSSIDLGVEAQGTAGNNSAGVQDNAHSPERAVMVYDDRNGLYGGVSFKTGVLAPDEKANSLYYGRFVTMNDILFNRDVHPTAAAVNLAQEVSADYTKR